MKKKTTTKKEIELPKFKCAEHGLIGRQVVRFKTGNEVLGQVCLLCFSAHFVRTLPRVEEVK